MYKQPREQLNLINNNPLTNLLFLLNQSLQQINPSLQIINPIPIKIFLNMFNSFRTIKSNISQTTKNINNASIYLSIYILLEHLLKQGYKTTLLYWLKISVIYCQISDGQHYCSEGFGFGQIFRWVYPFYEAINGLDDIWVLHEQKWSLCINTIQHQSIYCEIQLLL